MSFSELQMWLWLSSVQLVRLNEKSLPAGIASGCLIDYLGRRILLTVSHATGDQGNWAIQQKYVPGRGTCNYQLGAMNFLAKATLSNPTLEDVDFSYVEVPSSFIAYRQEIEASDNSVKSEKPINVHSPSLLDEPDNSEEFGFCGMVMPSAENHFGQVYFGGEIRVYDQLRFLRTEDDYHFFKLPFSHPGHDHFKGCSGAPIMDRSGRLVALVCGGCQHTSEVWGISVKAYKTPIDILVGNVS
ncbi:hypothetical protein [Halomonas llamarensis]|uniref:Serine protease n=1 Tax=Halomonas llamarensis TaxID=2945104 RepID=A0ABT0SU32_9GAMM|nr:hypothetical protein [Halomonas llamarensis]MCL7931353.1 hypothetical protein [Halomonas llamarensis]